MSLDWIGLSAFVIIDRNSQKKKTLRNFLSARLETNCHFEAL